MIDGGTVPAEQVRFTADDLVWELPYAPSIGHPARLSGREEVVRFVAWFVGGVEKFRFFDSKVYALADPDAAVAEVKAEAIIKATGRIYFDPARAAEAMDTPVLRLESRP